MGGEGATCQRVIENFCGSLKLKKKKHFDMIVRTYSSVTGANDLKVGPLYFFKRNLGWNLIKLIYLLDLISEKDIESVWGFIFWDVVR